MSASPLPAQATSPGGEIERVLADVEHVLRDGEARIQAILQTAIDAIITIDAAGTIQSFNPAAEQMFGYPAAEALGQNVELLMPSPFREQHQGYVSAYLHGGSPKAVGGKRRVLGRRKDGAVFPMELALSVVRTGDRVAFTGIARDISDREQAERELQAAKEAAEAGNRLRDVFLAMLSHELRNPLAPIRHAVSLLQRPDLPPATFRDAVRTLSEQVDHVIRLVDDLLDLSRITQGKIKIRIQTVDLRDCLRRAVEATRTLIEERRHELRVQVPDEPLLIAGDTDRLQQVIANLLNNAAKYTAPGGAIGVEAGREGAGAVLRVHDNGIGLTPDELARVFDPFVRGRLAETDAQGGMGVGLTLVHRLVELHQGAVEARSDGPGHGSEFLVRLPLAGPATPPSPAPAGTVPGRSSAPLPARKILIIDDNTAAADMLAALLRLDGHHVASAYDGETGLALARKVVPDVVLLDLRMPGWDGYETARRLRGDALTARTALIALTGLARPADRELAQNAMFDDYLVKPVDPGQLRAVLAQWPRAET